MEFWSFIANWPPGDHLPTTNHWCWGCIDAPGMLGRGELVNTFTGGELEWEKNALGTQYLRLLRGSGEGLIIRSETG